MRKIYLLCLVLFCGTSLNAQNIVFENYHFQELLVGINNGSNIGAAINLNGQPTAIDTNGDLMISVYEASQISELYVGDYLDDDDNYNITSIAGIEFFTNLTILDCSYRNITNLNVSSLTNLEELYCDFNNISNLNLAGLTSLKKLYCPDNNMSTLDTSDCVMLQYLNCNDNGITNLVLGSLPHIIEIQCSENSLQVLDLSGLNVITFSKLYCSDNLISTLNINPFMNLTSLYCSENQLSELNIGGLTNLSYFDCSNNNIGSLDLAGLNLKQVSCAQNLISSIDLSSSFNLTGVDLNNNPLLNVLNIKNGKNQTVVSLNNVPELQFVCVDESELTFVQNQVNMSGSTNCVINSYCSIQPGGVYYSIQGEQKYNAGGNGCTETDWDFIGQRYHIQNTQGSYTYNLFNSSDYMMHVPAGSHTITPVLELPDYFNISPSSVTVQFPALASPHNQDFCITPNGTHVDLEISIFPLHVAQPGFMSQYKIIYKNKGNQVVSGSVDFQYENSVIDFVSAVPETATQTTSNLTWEFAALMPFEKRSILVTFQLNSPIENPPLNGGDLLDYMASISPVSTDDTPSDNIFTLQHPVVNSFDPNDKTCLEGSAITPEMAGEYVHYMIRFENTGTYFAENIVVKDMIDTSKFDISSLIPLDGSHPFMTRITEVNKVEFIFENIMLPFDDENNDGYVAFKIRTKSTLVTGDTFSNSAAIYFDYNHPIITNTATTTFAVLGVDEQNFRNHFTLYPNPATEFLSLNPKENIEVSSVSVFNLNGQLNMTLTNPDLQKIDVSHLASGQYVIQLNTAHGMYSIKFLKK